MKLMNAVPARAARAGAPVWVVGDPCEFRELVTDVGRDLGLSLLALDADQAASVVGRAIQPGAVLLDDPSLGAGELFAAERVLICTSQRASDLAPTVVGDTRVRLLAKPFGLPALERALRWLDGSFDEHA